MRSFFLAASILVACGSGACGGKAVIDGDPNANAGGGGSSSTSSSQGASSSSGGDVQSIGLERALAYANCFPGGGDAINIELTLSFQNVASVPATVELVAARLKGSAGQTNFTMVPEMVTIAAMSTPQIELTATNSSGTPGCNWCNVTDMTLDVEMLIDGVPRTFTDAIDSVSCSF